MSKIVSPYPPPLNDELRSAKPGHSWWRFLLRPNEDGHVAIMQALPPGTEIENAKAFSYEFFDGADTVIDGGFDKPIGAVRVIYREGIGNWIDVLAEHAPSSSPYWRQITLPGDPHPEDA